MRKIAFLTGTRADYGKIKPIINGLIGTGKFEVYIFVTGMHLEKTYGETWKEIEKDGFANIYKFESSSVFMERGLAKTVEGFSVFIEILKPDLVFVHGDRPEALAGAITGSFTNTLVSHIEGGEVSGTIDELIRHAITKLSHIHFVANEKARMRLIQLGENPQTVFVVGSPDIDIMLSDTLPSLETVRSKYEIPASPYAIAIFHPVTTEVEGLEEHVFDFVKAMKKSGDPYIVIYPNNDPGAEVVLDVYDKTLRKDRYFRLFPSIRFEYFLTLLKYAKYIVGNSSVGIREAQVYGIPTVNIGTRQWNRCLDSSIINVDYGVEEIMKGIEQAKNLELEPSSAFGDGQSVRRICEALCQEDIWKVPIQKRFVDVI